MWKILELMRDTNKFKTKNELREFLRTRPARDYDFVSLVPNNFKPVTKQKILGSVSGSFGILPKVR